MKINRPASALLGALGICMTAFASQPLLRVQQHPFSHFNLFPPGNEVHPQTVNKLLTETAPVWGFTLGEAYRNYRLGLLVIRVVQLPCWFEVEYGGICVSLDECI